jgi:hypothetical protein
MPKRHPSIAVLFVTGGLLINGGLAALLNFGNAEAGMSDSTQSGYSSPMPYLISFGAFFVCGLIASLVPKISARTVLAVLGHLAPFVVLWLIRAEGWQAEVFFLVIIAVIFLFYSWCWIYMLKKRDNVAD